MSELTRNGTAEPVSRETKFSGANAGREIFIFSAACSADHEHD